ncbi:MAG: MarR family transcriptional regulator [Acidobacteria bacterium]|nr:MarR family transcriptional regulator [Acidobacteriota bacterium]
MTIIVITSILIPVGAKTQKGTKQTGSTGGREEDVYLSMLRTVEGLSRGVAETLSRADLTPTQYNALRILRGAGDAGVSCTEVSERMVTKDSDVTRLLDRLEARELISREREAKDRRRVVARITGEGLRVLAELDGPVAETHRRQLGHLGEKQLVTLGRLLKVAQNETG